VMTRSPLRRPSLPSSPHSPYELRTHRASTGAAALTLTLTLALALTLASSREQGLLHGFGGTTWAVVLTQSLGGILVAVCIKNADAIEPHPYP